MAIRPSAIAEEALKLRPAGADVIVRVSATEKGHTRFARSEVTSTGDVDDVNVNVTVAFGKKVASADANQTDAASLRTLVDRAARLARVSPENPEHMPLLGPQKYGTAAAAFDAATAKLDAPGRAAAVKACLAALPGNDITGAGFYEHSTTSRVLASSSGLRGAHAATALSLTMTARTADGTGSGWGGAFSHRVGEVDPGLVAGTAVDKAARSRAPRRLDPGRYTVVLEPAAVAELLRFLLFAFDARRADEGRSFFSKAGGGTKLGDKIFPDWITLRSDPADPKNPSAPFDNEGVPLKAVSWIDKGTVAALRYSRFWADKQKKTPNGMAQNQHLLGGSATPAELVKGVKRGILVTRFFYIRLVDPQSVLATGLTRDGVFLIENGEIVGPVNNFRFNESPVMMLKNSDALSIETARTEGGHRVPAIRTHEFNLASISEAI
jgi:predicted Zn-dependent protease